MRTSHALIASGIFYNVFVCYMLSNGSPAVFIWLVIILTVSMIVGIVIGVYSLNEKIAKTLEDSKEG